jgi:hypothetical protein
MSIHDNSALQHRETAFTFAAAARLLPEDGSEDETISTNRERNSGLPIWGVFKDVAPAGEQRV